MTYQAVNRLNNEHAIALRSKAPAYSWYIKLGYIFYVMSANMHEMC